MHKALGALASKVALGVASAILSGAIMLALHQLGYHPEERVARVIVAVTPASLAFAKDFGWFVVALLTFAFIWWPLHYFFYVRGGPHNREDTNGRIGSGVELSAEAEVIRANERRPESSDKWVPLFEVAEEARKRGIGTAMEGYARANGTGSREDQIRYYAAMLINLGTVYGLMRPSRDLEVIEKPNRPGGLAVKFNPSNAEQLDAFDITGHALWQNLHVHRSDMAAMLAEIERMGNDAPAPKRIAMLELFAIAEKDFGWDFTSGNSLQLLDFLHGLGQAGVDGDIQFWGRSNKNWDWPDLTRDEKFVRIEQGHFAEYEFEFFRALEENDNLYLMTKNIHDRNPLEGGYADIHVERGAAMQWLKSSAQAYRGRTK
jgi:hypothetical protein